MYELFTDEKEYILPNGKTVTGKYFVDSDQYPFAGKLTMLVELTGGIVKGLYPLNQFAEDCGVDVGDDDASTLNNIIAKKNRDKAETAMQGKTYSAVLKVAQFTALSLTDEQAVEVSDLYSEFEVGHDYKTGDRFQYNRSLFKVNQNHTSQAQWVPGDEGTEALYTNLMLDESGYLIWKQPTGAHDAYNTGDVVRYPDANGQLYKSTIDGNVWAPDAYPQGWEAYTEE